MEEDERKGRPAAERRREEKFWRGGAALSALLREKTRKNQ
jgi:hypothetical protein